MASLRIFTEPTPPPSAPSTAGPSPYKSGQRALRQQKQDESMGSARGHSARSRPSSSMPRGQGASKKGGRATTAPPGGRKRPSTAMVTKTFGTEINGMVRDIQDSAFKNLGKDAAQIDPFVMAEQQEQVMSACDMLGSVAKMMNLAELRRDTKVIGDELKDTCISQHREITQLKEQIAKHQAHSSRIMEENRRLHTTVTAYRRRLDSAASARTASPRAESRGGGGGGGGRGAMHLHTSSMEHSHSQRLVIETPQKRTADATELEALKEAVSSAAAKAMWRWEFDDVHHLLCSAVGADSACVLIRNTETDTFVGSDDGSVAGVGSLLRVPLADGGRNIALETAESRATVNIPDLNADGRYDPNVDIEFARDQHACLLSVPIFDTDGEGEVIGVVQVLSLGASGFDRKEEKTMEGLAQAMAESIEMRMENEKRQVMLGDYSRVIAERLSAAIGGSFDPVQVALVLEHSVSQITQCHDANVLWLDSYKGQDLICRASRGGGHEGGSEDKVLTVPVQGLIGKCLTDGSLFNIGDVTRFEGYVEEVDSVSGMELRSLLLIPFGGARGKVAGAVRLMGTEVAAFENFETAMINKLQGICTMSLGALLLNSTEERQTEAPTQRGGEEGGVQVSERAPLDRFCTMLSTKLAPLVTKGGTPVVRFWTVSESGTEIQTMPYGSQTKDGGKSSKVRSGGLDLGVCGGVVTSGRHVIVPVTCNHRHYYADLDVATADECHAPSMWIPLRSSSGRVAGCMAVFLMNRGKGGGGFSDEEVAMVLKTAQEHSNYFADLVYFNSVRTERDRWKQTSKAILGALAEVESSGKSATVRSVFSTLIDLDKCQVWMADNVKQILSLQAGQGASRQSVTVSINGAGAVSKAARSGEVSTAMSIGHDAVTEEWEIVVPIIDSTGQPLMVVQGNRVRLPFTPLDMGIINMCASFFNIAVEHAKVLSTVQTRTFDEAVMECLTIEGAMKAVILSACKLCRCHNALVYWPSPEGSMCQYYMEGGQVKMKNYFTTMGIAAACIAEQKPMLLPNAREHSRFHEGLDGVELPIFKYGHLSDDHSSLVNAAYLPIFDKDEAMPMAVLSVRDKKKRMAFTRSDLLSLNALTKQVSVALKNVERHEGLLERARIRDIRHTQMSQLNSIRTMQIEAMSKIATRVPFNTTVEGMTRSMSMLLGVELCKLHIVEERGTMVRSIGPSSLQDKMVEISKASQSHVICRVIKSNEAVLIDLQTIQADTSVKYVVDGVPMRNSLSVPLRSDSGQVFAVLQLVNKHEGAFTGSDELTVHMASTAFETVVDASLLSSVRFDIGLESIDHSPEDILNLILEKTMQLVSSDAGQVLLLVDEKRSMRRVAEITATGERVGVLSFVSGVDGHDDHVSTYDVTQGIAGSVVQTMTTICVPKLRQDPRFDPAVDLKCDYTGQSSLLCAPLVSSSGQVMGAIEVVKSGLSQFNQRELQLMDVLATQAGTLLHNRERHELQVARTVDNIVTVTTSVMKCLEVQPSVDVIVNRIADRAVSVVPCENAVLLFRGGKKKSREFWTKLATRDEDVKRFVKKAGRTAFTGERAHRDVSIPMSNGLISDCLTSKISLDVPFAGGDQRVSAEFESLCTSELKNLMMVPIFRNAKCNGIGLLVLMNKPDGPFLPDDSRRLVNFTEVIAAAVDNIARCDSWRLQAFLDAMVMRTGD